MSIDIASSDATLPPGTLLLEQTSIQDGGVHVFDFDGVVISSTEDDIYHLNEWKGEIPLLRAAARSLKINCEFMELKYQRHLIFQACCLRVGQGMEPGPANSALLEAASRGKVFVLTARSGWYAVERMRRYLEGMGVIPVDIFNVGRVKKDRQLDLICKEFNTSDVVYFEDNVAHLEAISKLDHKRLSLVWVNRKNPKIPTDKLQEMVVRTIEAAIT